MSSGALTNATAIGNGAIVNASNKIQLGNTSVTLVNTSGAITATGAITSSAGLNGTTITGTSIVKSGGTSAQFLKADGSVDANTYLTSAATTLDGLSDSKVGGTNFLNSLLIGHETTGTLNNADRNIGISGLVSITEGDDNIAIGIQTLNNTTTGSSNTVIGTGAVYYNTSNSYITAVGKSALHAEQGGGNTALGYNAGSRGPIASTLTNSTFLGNSASAGNGTIDNATAIGSGASVSASNTIQLGNGSVTLVNTSGAITASGAITSSAELTGTTITGTSIVKSGGTSAEFLKADGSVDATSYLVREVADEFTATVAQTSFTLTQTPSANSKVKMFVNGIRISNTAYSITGTTLTYTSSNNGAYDLSVSDRIQFDYFY